MKNRDPRQILNQDPATNYMETITTPVMVEERSAHPLFWLMGVKKCSLPVERGVPLPFWSHLRFQAVPVPTVNLFEKIVSPTL